jgi:hypothetical protein
MRLTDEQVTGWSACQTFSSDSPLLQHSSSRAHHAHMSSTSPSHLIGSSTLTTVSPNCSTSAELNTPTPTTTTGTLSNGPHTTSTVDESHYISLPVRFGPTSLNVSSAVPPVSLSNAANGSSVTTTLLHEANLSSSIVLNNVPAHISPSSTFPATSLTNVGPSNGSFFANELVNHASMPCTSISPTHHSSTPLNVGGFAGLFSPVDLHHPSPHSIHPPLFNTLSAPKLDLSTAAGRQELLRSCSGPEMLTSPSNDRELIGRKLSIESDQGVSNTHEPCVCLWSHCNLVFADQRELVRLLVTSKCFNCLLIVFGSSTGTTHRTFAH